MNGTKLQNMNASNALSEMLSNSTVQVLLHCQMEEGLHDKWSQVVCHGRINIYSGRIRDFDAAWVHNDLKNRGWVHRARDNSDYSTQWVCPICLSREKQRDQKIKNENKRQRRKHGNEQ